MKYWKEHRPALETLRDQLATERALRPRDPQTITAVALNPSFQTQMKNLLAQVAPEGAYDPARVGNYIEKFRTAVVTDPAAEFVVAAELEWPVRLIGKTSDARLPQPADRSARGDADL